MAESSSSGMIGPQRQKGKRVVVNKYTRHACSQCKKAKTKCEGGEPVCDRCLKTGHDCIWVEDNRKALTRHHEQALRHQNGVLKSEVDQLKSELAAIKAQLVTLNLKTESPTSSTAIPVETTTAGVHVSPPPKSLAAAAHLHHDSDDVNSSGIASGSEGKSAGFRSTSRRVNTLEDAEAYYTDISDREGAMASGSGSGLDGDGDVEIPLHEAASQHVSWKDLGVPSGAGAQGSDDDSGESSDDGSSSDSDYYDSSDLDDDDAVGMNRLVQPGKRLFVEFDDLHLYGLTSVFRLRQENRRRRHRKHYPESRHSEHDTHNSQQIRRRPSERTVRSRSRRQSFGANAVVGFKLANQMNVGDESSDGYVGVPVVRRSSKSREKSAGRGDRSGESGKGKGRKEKGRKARKKTRSGASTQRAPSQSASPSRADLAHNSSVKKHILLLSAPQAPGSATSPVQVSSTIASKEAVQSESRAQCECWTTCWARFLPPEVMEVMGRVEHDVLVDRALIFFSSWCMRVVPEYFLRDMYAALHPAPAPAQQGSSKTVAQQPAAPATAPKKAHYSPFLHNALLAVATAFSDDPRLSSPSQATANPSSNLSSSSAPSTMDSKSKELSPIRLLLAERAKSYIESECARPSVSAVQALSLLASVYSGMGEQTLGFMYFGMSARISQALGLNADYGSLLRTGRIKPQEVFDRMWCYHMGASQDACWSLYVGREFGIPMGPDDDPSVLEGLVDPMLDTMGWRQEPRKAVVEGEEIEEPVVPQKCGTFSVFLWSCYLMKISRRIMDLMNRLGKTEGGIGTEVKLLVADIDIQLIAWREELPQDLKLTPSNEGTALPHKLMMHLAYWWLLILLHRPFYRRRGIAAMDLTFSVNRCDLAAREILSLLRLWKKIYGTIRFTPITMIQIAFASGTIYIMAAIQAGTGRRPATAKQADALDRVKEMIDLLKEMGRSWGAATKIAGVFARLVGEVERGIEANNEGKRERKRRRTRTVTEATSPKVTATKTDAQMPPEMSIDNSGSDFFGDLPPQEDPLGFFSSQPHGAFSPVPDAAPYAFSPESDSPVSFTHLHSGGSGGDMSSASDSESGFMDFHPTSEPSYDLIHLYNSFMQNNLDFSGMDIDVSNLPGMSFGPNPGSGQSFNFSNGMTDGDAFMTQPVAPSFESQSMNEMGTFDMTSFGSMGGTQYNSFAGYNGLWNGMQSSQVQDSTSANQHIPRIRSNTGNVSFDLNDMTSDGEDRALRDVISSLGNEFAHRSSS
ncbi:hypothetical protein SCHPADRAFT_946303 [Schizopora paradoxa]|uniref:Zn(2)-C6 fungal-type domain-containing protein n=1 Tax=Schizopora paradoxa TaxID=27342 RepID=A0A0H2R9L6_9AGAM|nr:hypothetical protein SCHPADRAFT_946303 [Schizopora paradoxa]